MNEFLNEKAVNNVTRPAEVESEKFMDKIFIIIVRILIVALIAGIAAGGFWYFTKKQNSLGDIIDPARYQAVFLTNGQTYFGKVSGERKAYVTLDNVYYLLLKKPLQNQNQAGEVQNQDLSKPEYSLIKLGKEMHGPTSMSINRDQILFIENLADDSKVVTAIKNATQ